MQTLDLRHLDARFQKHRMSLLQAIVIFLDQNWFVVYGIVIDSEVRNNGRHGK